MSTNSGRFWVKRTKHKERVGPERAVLLCRQSLTKKESISIEDQEEQNHKYALTSGYHVVAVHRSPNVRGWQEDRADHDAIRALAANGEVDVVISYDVSRTARTVRIMENFAHDLEQLGCRLEFSAQQFANTTQGRQLLSLFAEAETSSRSIRLTDVWSYLRSKGRWHGVSPFGYKRLDKTIVIDETEAPIVRQIFAWAAAGKGTTWIANELYQTNVPTRNGGMWGQAHLSRLLRNPSYAGGMRIDGATIFPPEGLSWHEPMFSRAEWDAVQSILPDRPMVIRSKPVSSWLEGLIEHECGVRMHLIGCSTPRDTLISIFRCAHKTKPPRCRIVHTEVSARNVETAARTALLTDLTSVKPFADVERAIVEETKRDGSMMARKRIEKARETLEADRVRSESLYRAGRRTAAWFNAIDDEITAKLRALDAEASSIKRSLDLDQLKPTGEQLAALRLERVTTDDLALALKLLKVTVVVGEGGVRLRYPTLIARFLPEPCVVKIYRARTR